MLISDSACAVAEDELRESRNTNDSLERELGRFHLVEQSLERFDPHQDRGRDHARVVIVGVGLLILAHSDTTPRVVLGQVSVKVNGE